jgi:serine/threonine protein phosphatase PrpC
MRIRPGIELASLSDVGCQRKNNEDRYSYWEPASEKEFLRKGRLAMVADGMGGYEGGQEASRIAVEAIEEVYANGAIGNPRGWLLEAGARNSATGCAPAPGREGV